MTVAELLRAASVRLQQAGVLDAGTDARVLLADAMGVPRGRLTLLSHDGVPAATETRFAAMLEARENRQPVSQILGYRDFHGLRVRVTRDVLDPRPETETLVEAALEARFDSLIDLGTGSGAILLSLLAARPDVRGLGTDLSQSALTVARDNARALDLDTRARFETADWWSGIAGRFDLIVSNPPYIAADEMQELEPEVRLHEPHLALTPGGDGLDAYRAILAGLSEHLAPGGQSLLEIGAGQGAAVSALAREAGWLTPEVLRDLDGRDRIVRILA